MSFFFRNTSSKKRKQKTSLTRQFRGVTRVAVPPVHPCHFKRHGESLRTRGEGIAIPGRRRPATEAVGSGSGDGSRGGVISSVCCSADADVAVHARQGGGARLSPERGERDRGRGGRERDSCCSCCRRCCRSL